MQWSPDGGIAQLAKCIQEIEPSQKKSFRCRVASFGGRRCRVLEAMTMSSGIPVGRRAAVFRTWCGTAPHVPGSGGCAESFRRHHKLPAPRSVASIQNRGRPRMGWNYIRIDSSD